MATGRPSTYNQETADEICERLANGESYSAILRSAGDGWFPSRWTLARWLDDHDEFRTKYARARQIGAEARAEECNDIVKDATPETATLARLRWDNARWQAKVGNPARFGDKLQAELTGKDGGAIQTVTEVVRRVIRPDASDA